MNKRRGQVTLALIISLLQGASELTSLAKENQRGVEERSSLHFSFPYCQEQVYSLEGEPKRIEEA
jgi:hypothetical protein